jgi:hypothetical protein
MRDEGHGKVLFVNTRPLTENGVHVYYQTLMLDCYPKQLSVRLLIQVQYKYVSILSMT